MACIAAACGNGLHVRDSSGYAGTVTGYDTFDPMNYYDVWNGDTSIAPLVPARSVTKEEWTALVRKDRDQGLRLLSQDERLLLFQGALKALHRRSRRNV